MKGYKCLDQQVYKNGEFSLVPIRMEDRYDIMRWRNEQIYHLRQKEPLTEAQQDRYFEEVVSKLFDQEEPDQILFSFLEGEQLIGHGGLVHIHWEDKNAEVSFLQAENESLNGWKPFLELLDQVAFDDIQLRKIYTYAFDLRPALYPILKNIGFRKEAELNNHIMFRKSLINVVIHSKLNDRLGFSKRKLTMGDAELLYEWINDNEVRQQSLNNETISWSTHLNWLWRKLYIELTPIFLYTFMGEPIGMLRLDSEPNNTLKKINYLVAPSARGRGFGFKIITDVMNFPSFSSYKFLAEVKVDNIASNKIFKKLGFLLNTNNVSGLNVWIK